MSRHPEVHWSEGMFLRPQHFQMFSRQLGGMVATLWRRTQPYLWGFSDLEVAEDALEAFSFRLRRCEGVLRDGTWVQLPANLRVDPRDFKEALNASDGRLPVYLAVPVLREGEPNTASPDGGTEGADRRYRTEPVEVPDENLGGSARSDVLVRKLNARFLFGNESREGYETLPVAVLQRAGYGSNAPQLAAEFIPPLLQVSAWPALSRIGESILHRVEAKHRFLRAEVAEGRLVLDSEGTGGWQPVFKLQVVGSFLQVLRQLTGSPGIHPFHLYVELARLAGELSIFDDESEIAVPVYDHDRLGECYHEMAFILERLLERILSGRFVRVEFILERDIQVARLRDEWLAREAETYLCIESDLSDREILSRIETAKIGTSADLPLLKQRRLFGLDIDLLKRTPGGLPAREDYHFFSIAKEGPYWEAVARNREMAISGGDPRLRFCLYIILKPERQRDDPSIDTPGRR